MPHLLHLVVLAALVAAVTIALASLAADDGDELTEHQARVLCAAMKAIEHVAIAVMALLR